MELIVALPLLCTLLSAPLWIRGLLNQRIESQSRQQDSNLRNIWSALEKEGSRFSATACNSQTVASRTAKVQPWPEEVDRQRALTMATLRTLCLAEATGRLGKAALPLWGIHVAAPTDAAAKSTATLLCPRTSHWSEKLSDQVRQGHRLILRTETAKAAKLMSFLENSRIDCANSPVMLDSLFGPILGPSPRWRFSSVGRAVD